MLTKNTIHKIINHLKTLDSWEHQAVESAIPHVAAEATKTRRSLAYLIRQLKDEIGEAPRLAESDIPFDEIESILSAYETLWYESPYSLGESGPPPAIQIVQEWVDRAVIPF